MRTTAVQGGGAGANGFTMLELMIVLVIIGIVAAVIVPEMRGTYEGELLRSNARKLISAMALASSQAVARNQSCQLQIDSRNGRYFLEHTQRDDGNSMATLRDLPGGEGELDSRIQIEVRKDDEDDESAAENPHGRGLVFRPDGTAQPAEVLLRDRLGFGLALKVNPATSRVRIAELARP